mmetsp:Transcript_108208/g.338479  ORF Transcript_108208/g.338479 Transcript_108208/m.338479 type:complete len:200 (-) Transcript_108208:591-1190(-)
MSRSSAQRWPTSAERACPKRSELAGPHGRSGLARRRRSSAPAPVWAVMASAGSTRSVRCSTTSARSAGKQSSAPSGSASRSNCCRCRTASQEEACWPPVPVPLRSNRRTARKAPHAAASPRSSAVSRATNKGCKSAEVNAGFSVTSSETVCSSSSIARPKSSGGKLPWSPPRASMVSCAAACAMEDRASGVASPTQPSR